jgi:hypothetical protein
MMKYRRTRKTFIVEGILDLALLVGGIWLLSYGLYPQAYFGAACIFSMMAHSLTYGIKGQ